MGRVIVDKSMSLDGFIAGPHDEIEPLHEWLADNGAVAGRVLLEELLARVGAVVMGRRTFSMIDGPEGWLGPDGTPFALPVVVLTHQRGEPVTKGQTAFSFATSGIEDAVTQAREAAGDKDISVMGADAGRQALQAGLVDEVVIHLVPVLLGNGIRMFEHLDRHVHLEATAVLQDPHVTHHRYRVVR
ncbi:MAG: dihydrofolate reductase family protein [Acidimicrobiales bacterium]